jgi:hypothetical protein
MGAAVVGRIDPSFQSIVELFQALREKPGKKLSAHDAETTFTFSLSLSLVGAGPGQGHAQVN